MLKKLVYIWHLSKSIIWVVEVVDWKLWERLVYDKVVWKWKSIWAIYEFEIEGWTIKWYTNNNSIWYFEDDKKIHEWRFTDRAIKDSEIKLKELSKKEEDFLKELRRIYLNIPYNSRTAFIAKIIKTMTW
jgi:hypothetical protein